MHHSVLAHRPRCCGELVVGSQHRRALAPSPRAHGALTPHQPSDELDSRGHPPVQSAPGSICRPSRCRCPSYAGAHTQTTNQQLHPPPPPQQDSRVQLEQDQLFMRMALEEAEAAGQLGEVPVGAVLVAAGGARVLMRAGNRTHTLRNPVAHAELLTISGAAEALSSWRLLGTTLYCTLEPCPMCAGAILQARIGRLVYAARQPLLGADGSWVSLFPPPAEEGEGEEGEGQKDAQGLPHDVEHDTSTLEQQEDQCYTPTLMDEALQPIFLSDSDDEGRRSWRAGNRSRSPSPQVPQHPFHRGITVTRGVLAAESAELLRSFFRRRRKEQQSSRRRSPSLVEPSEPP